jgi:hypothetical protein
LSPWIKQAVFLFQAFGDGFGCFVYAKLGKVKACITTRFMSV